MNWKGNKSIANISISNPGFAGNLLLLGGEIEPSCTERNNSIRNERVLMQIPVFTRPPALLLVFLLWFTQYHTIF